MSSITMAQSMASETWLSGGRLGVWHPWALLQLCWVCWLLLALKLYYDIIHIVNLIHCKWQYQFTPSKTMCEEKVSDTSISVQPSSAVCPSTLACSTQAWKCMVQVTLQLASFTPTLRDLFQALQPPFLLLSLWTPLLTRRRHCSCLPTHQHKNV